MGRATNLETAARSKASIRWKRVGLSLAATLSGMTALSSVVTQYVAARFDYHPALGAPIIGHLYVPWAWIEWSAQPWAASAPALFARAKLLTFAVVGGAFALAFVGRQGKRTPQRYEAIYGTAVFAGPEDMAASGFLDQSEGVYIGGWKDPSGTLHYLRHKGAEHVAAIAPTRSGKGVGLVLPTLLSWLHSALIYDEKGELYHLTGGWRASVADNVVLRWQPGSPDDSCAFNFLDTVRIGTMYEVSDAQNIALMLCDPDGRGIQGDHWRTTAYDLITGLILHKCYKMGASGRTASLPDIAAAMSNPNQPADALYQEMVANEDLGDGERHDFVAEAGMAQLNRDVKERTSVHSAAVTALGLFRDPIVAGNSRVSDFTIMDLMNHDRPVSLYIVVPGPDKDRLRPLVRLLLTTIVRGLTGVTIRYGDDGRPLMPHRHPLLLMMDEFPSLGRMTVIESALPTVAGFGIKAYLIMQDREQLIKAYGVNETVLANCHIQIAYAPNRYETAKWISGILGKYTANVEDYSESGKRLGALSNVSHSIRQVAKDLMTPEQVMSLAGPEKVGNQIVSAGEMLIWAAGMKARIRGTQILYFNDPVFSARSRIPVPPGKASIRNLGMAFTV